MRSYEYSKEMTDGDRRGDGFDSRQGQKSEAMRKIIIIRRVLAQAFGVETPLRVCHHNSALARYTTDVKSNKDFEDDSIRSYYNCPKDYS